MRTYLLLSLLLLSATTLRAQYQLTETGPLIAAGVALPLGNKELQIGPSVMLGGFFTHYRCGKRDGWWLEGGVRYVQVSDKADSTTNLRTALPEVADDYSFINLEVGAYYKIRLRNYHRPREFALLIGPKLSYRLNSQSAGTDFESDSYREVATGMVGAHLSVLYRLPVGVRYSLLVGAGGEYYFADAVKTTGEAKLRYANLFLRVGYVLWNSR